MQTRKVFCEKDPEEEFCDQSTRPETSRTCSSNRTCSGQWFTGPWTAVGSNNINKKNNKVNSELDILTFNVLLT